MPWIVGGAILIGGLLQSSATSKARKDIKEGRDFAVNKSGLSQYKDSGLAADKRVNDLLGNNNGDTGASELAFQKYLDSTGYRFNRAEGQQAIDTSFAAKGLGKSGAALKAAAKYGTNIGASYFNSYINQENTVANRGANAASNLASIYSGTGAALAANSEKQGAIAADTVGGLAGLFGDQQGGGSGSAAPKTTSFSSYTGGNATNTLGAPQTPVSPR